ncbi:uncharacterized protein LOC141589794 [Silene latifolia]|uniref:uncharacterized protein LOC141589794 n=1 Tax=Silene latifolia TaxID=37657 RepID=UPI003D779269
MKEQQQFVLNNGHLLFDNKPVIVNEWKPDTELGKHDVKCIPIWMKLYDLDVKFWGLTSLKKLSSVVGRFIRCDENTLHKNFLGFARVMIEVEIRQQFPDQILFLDENGKNQKARVQYDWLPLSCSKLVESTMPRRLLTRLLKHGTGEKKTFTPGGLSFMESLTQSIQKTRLGIMENRVVEKGETSKSNAQYGLHRGGRIWLLWDPSLYDVTVLDIQVQCIHSEVFDKARRNRFWFTVVYGLNKLAEREPLWASLRSYSARLTGPWMVTQDCQLYDLGAKGAFYTWTNKHEVGSKFCSRLDRVLINDEWLADFPDSYSHFLPEGVFDHCPTIIRLEMERHRTGYSFKYYNMWASAPDYKEVVRNGWNQQGAVGDIENLTHLAEIALAQCQEGLSKDPLNVELNQAEKIYALEVVNLQKARDQFLRQKAKVDWMQMGDCNSAYFHASIKSRRSKNRVFQVKDMNGLMCSSPEKIQNAFEDYYISLLGTSQAVRPINRKIVQHVYKCVSKVLCGRMGQVLPDIISQSQGAFIKGRDIVGNILICQDLIKLYKRKSCSPRAMMKIDLQKAYDSVELAFVGDMLDALGFPIHICKIVKECISTTSYSISLNGEIFGFFKGKRGLRQGDPLSPLLFTICLEYLSRILLVVQKHHLFRFHPLCNRIQLSHLCFADDLILFCRGDRGSIELLMNAFSMFSKATGLTMNKSKSSVYCNRMEEHTLREVELITGMKRGTVSFSYLGVTVSPKRLSVQDCQCLIDKVVDRIRGMGSRKLSYAGRLVLIKAVLSTLHGYWSRIFILPKMVISKIEAICRRYLWHGADQKESPALGSWANICQPRKQGGLGLKDFHVWNLATVGNWAWRKICQVKQLLKPYLSNLSSGEHYTITAGYQWLKPAVGQVSWYPWMLNQWLIPKQQFICWLLAQRSLLTQDRLLRMGIIQSNSCFLCGLQEESVNHLFFECPFSRQCRDLVSDWCKVSLPLQNCINWWTELRQEAACRKKVIAVILSGLLYHVWQCRNRCRVEESVVRPCVVLASVQSDVKMRLGQCDIQSKNTLALEWVEYLKA